MIIHEQFSEQTICFIGEDLEERIKLHRYFNDDEENCSWGEWYLVVDEVDGEEDMKNEEYFKTVLKCIKLANKRFKND